MSLENFSIHVDIDTSARGGGTIRDEIMDLLDHEDIVEARTSVVRPGSYRGHVPSPREEMVIAYGSAGASV